MTQVGHHPRDAGRSRTGEMGRKMKLSCDLTCEASQVSIPHEERGVGSVGCWLLAVGNWLVAVGC